MALLGIGSLVGGLATDPGLLLAARVAQGLATAGVTPAALSLLTTSFPEGPLRDKALGLNGSLMAAGFTAGAILGGLLTDLLSWRWAFFINVPIAVFVSALAPKLLTESTRGNKTKLDVPGAVTVTLALLLLVFGLTTAGEKGWADTLAWGPLAAGLFLFVVFFFIEKNTAHALVPVTILRRNNIAWGNIAGILAFATETSLVFVLTLYLQQVLGYTPLGAGLAFAVLGIGTVVGGIIAPQLIGKLGNKNTIITGLTIQAAATGSLFFITTDQASLAIVLIATFVGGVANLAAIVGFMVTATTGLPDSEQGIGHGSDDHEPADRHHDGYPRHEHHHRRVPAPAQYQRRRPGTGAGRGAAGHRHQRRALPGGGTPGRPVPSEARTRHGLEPHAGVRPARVYMPGRSGASYYPSERSDTMPLGLTALAAGGFGIGLIEFVILGLLPEVAIDFNVTIPVAGYLVFVYALSVAFGGIFVTAIAAGRNPKRARLAHGPVRRR